MIKTVEALAAKTIMSKIGFAKRPTLQRLMGEHLGREVTDEQFEVAMSQNKFRRVRGCGGGIYG